MIELLWNAPVSEAKMTLQIAALALRDGQRVLDVGCGCGECLIRVCEQHAVYGTGIDSSADHIVEARRRVESRVVRGNVEFAESDAKDWPVDRESLDLAICLGASHAFGLGPNAYHHALQQMMPMVRRGGQILISEGYAKQPIPEGYKEFIGDTITDDMTHEANVRVGVSLGLVPLGAWTSNVDEWDEFEWSYQRIVEHHARNSDANEEDGLKLRRRREWMDGYLRWGRNTLGYGTYLFIKPAKS